MHLDYAEDETWRHVQMHMLDWIAKLDSFRQLNEHEILTHSGTVSHQLAQEHAAACKMHLSQLC
jgi:hypothetical protein